MRANGDHSDLTVGELRELLEELPPETLVYVPSGSTYYSPAWDVQHSADRKELLIT